MVSIPPPNTFAVPLMISSAQGESGLSSCPPWPWRRRMRLLPLATLRLIPASKIKLRRTVSQSVAVILWKARVKATRPISEKVKVIHSQRTVKTVKSLSGLFQLETPAVQSVPTKTGWGDFTAFALILRMGMGGGGRMNPYLNLNPNLSEGSGAAQRRKTGLLRWQIHRIHGKNFPEP